MENFKSYCDCWVFTKKVNYLYSGIIICSIFSLARPNGIVVLPIFLLIGIFEEKINTFNIINKHLETTFSMFFEGGECYLNLLDKDNPLESNIEIFARPPGK